MFKHHCPFSADNPATVTLVTNITENKDCSDLMVVNFTCAASDANPAVANYQLYASGGLLSVSNSGTWNKEIPEEGKHVYSCLAEHPLGNVTSANNVTLNFNGKFCSGELDFQLLYELKLSFFNPLNTQITIFPALSTTVCRTLARLSVGASLFGVVTAS